MPTEDGKVKILFFTAGDPKVTGVGYWRVLQPAYFLKELFKDQMSVSISLSLPINTEDYDIYIFQRIYEPHMLQIMMELRANGKFVAHETDDLLNKIPSELLPEISAYYRKLRPYFKDVLKCSNLLITTHEHLANAIRQTNEVDIPYIIVPNAVDTVRLQQNHPEDTDTIRIGWFGHWVHRLNLTLIRGLLEEVYDQLKNKINIELITFGPEKSYIAKHLFKSPEPLFKWTHYDWMPASEYVKTASNLKIHIGLAPIQDTKWDHYRTPLKILEYTLYGAVFLASDLYPYSETLTDCKEYTHVQNRLLLWKEKLINLIMNHSLRKEIHNKLKTTLALKHDCRIIYKKYGEDLLNFYYQWLKNH